MEIDESKQLSSDGLMWLLQMGAVDTAAVKNALVLNIRESSLLIRDLEILTDTEGRKMLVLLRLNWLGRWLFWWRKPLVAHRAMLILQSGLPYYQFRVIYDEALFQKALAMSQKLAERRKVVPTR